jgi:hypothetical protein
MIDRLYKLVTKAAAAELTDFRSVHRRDDRLFLVGSLRKDFVGYTYEIHISIHEHGQFWPNPKNGDRERTIVSKRCWTFKCGSEWVKHLVDTYGKLLPGFESIPKDLPDDCKVTNYRKAVLELIRKALFKFTTKFYF